MHFSFLLLYKDNFLSSVGFCCNDYHAPKVGYTNYYSYFFSNQPANGKSKLTVKSSHTQQLWWIEVCIIAKQWFFSHCTSPTSGWTLLLLVLLYFEKAGEKNAWLYYVCIEFPSRNKDIA